SDVCSSDLRRASKRGRAATADELQDRLRLRGQSVTNVQTATAPAERDSVRRRLARRLHWRKRTRATVAKRRVQLVLFVLLLLLGAVLATGVGAAFSLYPSAQNR